MALSRGPSFYHGAHVSGWNDNLPAAAASSLFGLALSTRAGGEVISSDSY